MLNTFFVRRNRNKLIVFVNKCHSSIEHLIYFRILWKRYCYALFLNIFIDKLGYFYAFAHICDGIETN